MEFFVSIGVIIFTSLNDPIEVKNYLALHIYKTKAALGVFFSTLAEAWGWDLPTQAILTTLSAIELFLGAIFGISKVIYDRKENPEKDL